MPVNMLDSANSWTEAHQIPLSMGFSKQEYSEGSHSLLHGILLSRAQTQAFLHCRWILYHLSHQGSPIFIAILVIFIINEIIILSTKYTIYKMKKINDT